MTIRNFATCPDCEQKVPVDWGHIETHQCDECAKHDRVSFGPIDDEDYGFDY